VNIGLRETAEAIVEEVFVDIEAHPAALAKVLEAAKREYEPPVVGREALEAQLVDQTVDAIKEWEIYASKKSGTE
jgi:hypothetical protein